MKILLSWCAFNNDFIESEVNTGGPTYQFHQHFFKHDRHLILSSAEPDEDIRLDKLINRLSLDFPDRRGRIEGRGMSIKDPINMPEIKSKVETLLLGFSEADEIDLFISPGTPAMQVAWYLCHTKLALPTRLFQTRAPKFTASRTLPELVEVQTEQSSVPVSVVLREHLQDSAKPPSESFYIPPTLQPVYDRARRVTETDRVTCLIQGASGTGKENLARYIHANSSRADQPFVAVNCASLGDTLLESRLFGYEKGAFTGADKKSDGFFDAAKGGTLFLDEIGDISPYMQQSLLRVLQEREFLPVGSTKARKTDVRIVAATHKSLRQACQEGRYRWDLFYRLSVAELKLPALSDWRLSEKQELIQYFIKKKQETFRRTKRLRLTAAASRHLDGYLFPGNVRELENLIESFYVFADDSVDINDLPLWVRQPGGADTSFNWQAHEKELIRQALLYFSGNKTRTLEALGYGSINTLEKKIKVYQLKSTK